MNSAMQGICDHKKFGMDFVLSLRNGNFGNWFPMKDMCPIREKVEDIQGALQSI